MKILLVPSVKEIYKNQVEFCVDQKLSLLLKKIFLNCEIEIFNNNPLTKYNLIVFCGGNSLKSKKSKDLIRKNISEVVFDFAIKKRIRIIGICYGAQFIANNFGFKLRKSKVHVGNHKINLNVENTVKKINVNSYHDEILLLKKSKNINVFATGKDQSVEGFHIKKKKILGIMWHPERYSKFKKFDFNLIKSFYATNTINCG